VRILPRSGFVQLCIQADAGTVSSLALAIWPARLNAALARKSYFLLTGGTMKTTSPIALPETVRDIFAARHHRLHHALWHGLRDRWNHSSLPEVTKKAIENLNWHPPRPATRWFSGGGMPETTNGSGVDFLYMHREMIAEFDKAMVNAGANSDIGWQVVPEPGRPSSTHPGIDVPTEWELPDGLKWLQRRFAVVKSDEFYWCRMRWWDRDFHNHGYLRTLSLGQLGSILETSIHNDMHMRWAAAPRDPETDVVLVLGRPETSIDNKWDAPAYDFLGETYSSHVNPIFWRLHKWVDGIIDEWFDAHEGHHPGEISKTTLNGVKWFESEGWIETDSPWSSPSPHAHHDVPSMEKVYRLLYPEARTFVAIDESTSAPKNWFR